MMDPHMSLMLSAIFLAAASPLLFASLLFCCRLEDVVSNEGLDAEVAEEEEEGDMGDEDDLFSGAAATHAFSFWKSARKITVAAASTRTTRASSRGLVFSVRRCPGTWHAPAARLATAQTA
jgi:hypothetical protein